MNFRCKVLTSGTGFSRVLILNYEQPCNSTVVPPVTQVIQVGCLAFSSALYALCFDEHNLLHSVIPGAQAKGAVLL